MALSGIKPPELDWTSSNLPETWKKFRQHVELIFDGPLKDVGEEVKRTYLLLWIGQRGRDVYSTWKFEGDDEKKIDPLYDKFEQYVQPKANAVFSRFKFNNIVQGTSQFDDFVTRLRIAAKDCAFKDTDEMLRDRIVFGVNSQKVREKLITEGQGLSLEKAVQIGQSYEYAQEQLRSMNKPDTNSATPAAPVHAINRSKGHHSISTGGGTKPKVTQHSRNDKGKQSDNHTRKKTSQRRSTQRQSNSTRECGNCGYQHTAKNNYKCPAKGEQCKKCLKFNHFAAKCRSVACVSVECDETESFDDFYVDMVNANIPQSQHNDQAFVDVNMGPQKKSVSFKLDTGAQVNVIPSHIFYNIFPNHALEKPAKRLSSYNGSPIKTLGCCQLQVEYKGHCTKVEMYIAESASYPILGLQACLDLQLIKLIYAVNKESGCPTPGKHKPLNKENVLSDYADVFKGIGKFPGKVTIHVDPEAQPVVNPPRKVPVALRDKLKTELDRMVSAEVITKVNTPTPWVNSLVVVEKSSGKLRVCLDPQNLNRAIMRPHHPMKTLEEILPDLTGAQYFTKLDARSGYWALELDDESSMLTTFNTPHGRYRFLRMPFGIHSAQDEFQRVIDDCFESLNGVNAIVDDILVHGKSRDEHDANLRAVLERSRSVGIKFNEDKLEVGTTSVQYFGHLLTQDGIKPDPDKVSAVRDMQPPRDKGELETILGMINYLAKFAPNLSQITSPLRSLLPKNVEFRWEQPQDEAFVRVKNLITQNPVLAYYDPSVPVTLQVDASKFGLGATLMQSGKPVAYASKSLTQTEVQYAQIEKEMYAILFGCKRFHHYVYGRHIDVESDHKPLESILKKPIGIAPARLQRMMLQLQKYNISVRHVPGKQIPVADTLSRKFTPHTYPEISDGMDVQVHTVLSNIPVSSRRMTEIRELTLSDPEMVTLAKVVQSGWPENRRDCPMSVLGYWNFRDELTVMGGIIFKGPRIVIPTRLRETMLELLHSGHMGIEKCRNRARDIMFWPGMNSDISDLILNCSTCLELRNSNAKEPMLPREIPSRPWQIVASDLFSWNDSDYLVVVDYHSNYFEIAKLSSTSSLSVITRLKEIFSRFGIPEKLISDNGPQYSSEKFGEFSRAWDFIHETSSPLHPSSNGLAERTVQTVKRILTKAKSDGQDPYIALLEYRTTPLESGLSPSQLLMSRRLRSILPTTREQLEPSPVSNRNISGRAKQRKRKQKFYHDKTSKPLPDLDIGETVRIKRNDRWKPAVVTKQDNARSYTVNTPDGGVYRRNRCQIMKTNETPLDYEPHQMPSMFIGQKTCIPTHNQSLQKYTTPGKQETPQKPETPRKSETPQKPKSENPKPKAPDLDKSHSQVQPPKLEMNQTSSSNDSAYITRSGRQVKVKYKQSM